MQRATLSQADLLHKAVVRIPPGGERGGDGAFCFVLMEGKENRNVKKKGNQ